MESILKCATLPKSFASFVPLSRDGFPEHRKGVAHTGGSGENHKGALTMHNI